MTQPKLWFLDVDGVLNAVAWAPPPGYKTGFASPDGGKSKFRINWDPRVIARINEVHDDGLVEPVWLTTWGSRVNNGLRELIGINELKVLEEPPDDYGFTRDAAWWKLQAVRKHYVEDGRRFVWTDDDLALEPVAREWARDRNVYTVAPRPHVGLTSADVNHIVSYLNPGVAHSF